MSPHVIACSSSNSKLTFLHGHIVVGESTDGTTTPPTDDGVRRSMFVPIPNLEFVQGAQLDLIAKPSVRISVSRLASAVDFESVRLLPAGGSDISL